MLTDQRSWPGTRRFLAKKLMRYWAAQLRLAEAKERRFRTYLLQIKAPSCQKSIFWGERKTWKTLINWKTINELRNCFLDMCSHTALNPRDCFEVFFKARLVESKLKAKHQSATAGIKNSQKFAKPPHTDFPRPFDWGAFWRIPTTKRHPKRRVLLWWNPRRQDLYLELGHEEFFRRLKMMPQMWVLRKCRKPNALWQVASRAFGLKV